MKMSYASLCKALKKFFTATYLKFITVYIFRNIFIFSGLLTKRREFMNVSFLTDLIQFEVENSSVSVFYQWHAVKFYVVLA